MTAASGALMMVRRRGVPRARRLLRAAVHVRRGGRLLPARAGAGRAAPGQRGPPREGHASGPAALAARLYWPSRNRLVNAARQLPRRRRSARCAPRRRSTCSRWRRRGALDAARALGRGWRDGLRAMPAERRSPPERRAQAGGADGWSRSARCALARAAAPRTGSSVPTCAACGAELPDRPALRGRDRLHGLAGRRSRCASALRAGAAAPSRSSRRSELGQPLPERLPRLRPAARPVRRGAWPPRSTAGGTGARSHTGRWAPCDGCRPAGCSTSAPAAATSASSCRSAAGG